MTYLYYIPKTNYVLEMYEDKKIKKIKAKYRYGTPIFDMYFRAIRYAQSIGKKLKAGDKIIL